MENFNKVLSFFLGLVVVIVFVVVLFNRLNLGGKFLPLADKKVVVTPTLTPIPTPTPATQKKEGFFTRLFGKKDKVVVTPTPTPEAFDGVLYVTPTPVMQASVTVGGNTKGGQPKQIPSTGIPALLIPISVAAFAAGRKLQKTGK